MAEFDSKAWFAKLLAANDWARDFKPPTHEDWDEEHGHAVEESFRAATRALLRRSDLIVAQAFTPTDFDWRIGVLANEPLYACRYHMARRHWQIVKRDATSSEREEGGTDGVPIDEVPPAVLEAALQSARLMGDGLYGVDLKEVDGQPMVIEVNDNPSIDAGCEDAVLGPELYRRIMADFRRRLDARRNPEAVT